MDVQARCVVEIAFEDELIDFLEERENYPQPLLYLGGGSNVLFLDDFPGTVVRLHTKGVDVIHEDDHSVTIQVAAGENWDELVQLTVDRGWGGLENLSLIPGNVGTAPIQNIGAYGVEVKDVITKVEVISPENGKRSKMKGTECAFGYRTSVFKTQRREDIILNVTFQLSKKPLLKTDYGAIQEELKRAGVTNPTLRDVRAVVCDIRRKKLPDPAHIGNAGSFFKNPVVTHAELLHIQTEYPKVVYYPHGDNFKLAAAWLIETAGWKGKRIGDAGVHTNQPLVLVNYGDATGMEMLDLARKIISSVYSKFGVQLDPEVNLIG